jgi:hypothetical protein
MESLPCLQYTAVSQMKLVHNFATKFFNKNFNIILPYTSVISYVVHSLVLWLEFCIDISCIFSRAIAEVVSRWLPTGAAQVRARVWQVGFVVDKVASGQVFSEYFGFPYQNCSFHQLLHPHNRPGHTHRGLATSWSPIQRVLQTVLDLATKMKLKVSWRRPRPKIGL